MCRSTETELNRGLEIDSEPALADLDVILLMNRPRLRTCGNRFGVWKNAE